MDTSGDRVGSMLQSAAPINQVSEDKGPVDVNGVRYGGGDETSCVTGGIAASYCNECGLRTGIQLVIGAV